MRSNVLQFTPRAEHVVSEQAEVDTPPTDTVDMAKLSVVGLHTQTLRIRELRTLDSPMANKLRQIFETVILEYPNLKEQLEPMLDCKIIDTAHGYDPLANVYAVFRDELIAEASLYPHADPKL